MAAGLSPHTMSKPLCIRLNAWLADWFRDSTRSFESSGTKMLEPSPEMREIGEEDELRELVPSIVAAVPALGGVMTERLFPASEVDSSSRCRRHGADGLGQISADHSIHPF